MSVNFTQEQGLEEGSATEQMGLKHATHPVLQVQILGSQHNDELAFIPRITLIPSRQPGFNFRLRRCQFPVRSGFSLMMNKAQAGDQSVQHVGLYLQDPAFSQGQLYVALSRATSSHRMEILLHYTSTDCRLLNVVYRKIFTATHLFAFKSQTIFLLHFSPPPPNPCSSRTSSRPTLSNEMRLQTDVDAN